MPQPWKLVVKGKNQVFLFILDFWENYTPLPKIDTDDETPHFGPLIKG